VESESQVAFLVEHFGTLEAKPSKGGFGEGSFKRIKGSKNWVEVEDDLPLFPRKTSRFVEEQDKVFRYVPVEGSIW
jgi:hypothetical protein